jgi:uncharacterized protein
VIQSIDLLGFLTLGLLGGFGHCVGMCSPFVLFVSRRYGSPSPPFGGFGQAGRVDLHAGRRAAFVAQAWYTCGRITTYAALGAVAGALGGVVELAGAVVGVQRAALILAGSGLVAWALIALSDLVRVAQAARLRPATARLAEAPSAQAARPVAQASSPVAQASSLRSGTLFSRVAGLLKGRAPGHPLLVGLFLGLLPCGLLYSAVIAAVSRGGALQGAVALAAFGLGTAPALLGLSLADQLLARNRAVANRLSQLFILAMGAWFLWRGIAG